MSTVTRDERSDVPLTALRLIGVWCIALAPALLAVAFNPLSDFYVYALPKRRVLLILVGVAMIASAIEWIGRRSAKDRMPRAIRSAVLAYAAVVVLAGILSPNRWLTLWGWPRRYEGVIPTLAYLALFVLTFRAAMRLGGELTARWSRAYVMAAVLVAGYALLQYFGVDPFFAGPTPDRPHSTLGNPVWLAAAMAMMEPVSLAVFVTGGPIGTVLGMVGLTASHAALMASLTRSAWVGLAAGLAVLAVRSGRWAPWVRRERIPVAAAVLVAVTVLFFWPAGPFDRGQEPGGSLRRADVTTITEDASARERVYIWSRTLRAFAARPILGWGPDALRMRVEGADPVGRALYRLAPDGATYIDRAHNEILQVLATTGLAGLAAYLWLVVGSLQLLSRSDGRGDGVHPFFREAVLAAVAAALIAIQFQPTSLAVSASLWALLGLGAGLGASRLST